MVAGEGAHDVKNINELFIDRKDQSRLNRFFTEPKWNIDGVVRENKPFINNLPVHREEGAKTP